MEVGDMEAVDITLLDLQMGRKVAGILPVLRLIYVKDFTVQTVPGQLVR